MPQAFDDQQFPHHLYRAQQSRELDRLAIETCSIPGFTLMKRAARAIYQALSARWPTQPLVVLCGVGNNAGDGYLIAALAQRDGRAVQLYQVAPERALSGDARLAQEQAQAEGVTMRPWQTDISCPVDAVLVDALLGTGLQGAVREPFAAAIDWLNRQANPCVAVDIPSGLCADTGAVLGGAVKADLTVTLIAAKRGLCTGAGPALVGTLLHDDLSVPAALFEQVGPTVERLQLSRLRQHLPGRPADAHKGHYGHLLVVGGDSGMGGAALLAGSAAARLGTGLVSVATQPHHVAAFLARQPELMTHPVISGQELEPLLERPDAVVIGPGLGQRPWGEQMLQRAWQADCPLVVDADALNLIAAGRIAQRPRQQPWVMTPHPGEAARLLGISTAEVSADRFRAVEALQDRYGAVVVLKGAGTLVGDGEAISLCSDGNAGMASGGMGDLLSGVLGALLAQGMSPLLAAQLAVCLHARAGDLAAQVAGPCGLLASDLLLPLRRVVNGE